MYISDPIFQYHIICKQFNPMLFILGMRNVKGNLWRVNWLNVKAWKLNLLKSVNDFSFNCTIYLCSENKDMDNNEKDSHVEDPDVISKKNKNGMLKWILFPHRLSVYFNCKDVILFLSIFHRSNFHFADKERDQEAEAVTGEASGAEAVAGEIGSSSFKGTLQLEPGGNEKITINSQITQFHFTLQFSHGNMSPQITFSLMMMMICMVMTSPLLTMHPLRKSSPMEKSSNLQFLCHYDLICIVFRFSTIYVLHKKNHCVTCFADQRSARSWFPRPNLGRNRLFPPRKQRLRNSKFQINLYLEIHQLSPILNQIYVITLFMFQIW